MLLPMYPDRTYAESIVATVREPLLVLNADMKVVSANRSFYQTFKVSPEEAQGRLLYDLGNRQWSIPKLRELLEEVLPKNTSVNDFEVEHDFETIGWRIMLLNARRIYREANKAQIILLAIEDITERRTAERAAQEAREYAESIVATVREPLLVLDADMKLVSANRSFYQTFKVSSEESQGRLVYDLGNRQWDIPKLRELLEEVFPKNTSVNDFEVEHTFETIGRRIMLLNARRIYAEANKPQMILLAIEDITEHRKAERDRARYREHLEDVVRELEAFSHSVAHDLRAPLRHIDGFTGLLAEHLGPSLDATGRRYLTKISDSAREMGKLIDDLLTFARIGRAELHSTRFYLAALMQEVLRTLEPETVGRDIEWVMSPLPAAQGDPLLLRLVFQNLLGNALKYTRPKPRARIEIGVIREEAELIFSIRDNGVGFDMRYVYRLFGVFQRLHSGAEFEGTGIGLANVKRIVQRHGGRVWAEGAVGEGACFYFSLPDLA
jgi:PAS domain S-box-containing protein